MVHGEIVKILLGSSFAINESLTGRTPPKPGIKRISLQDKTGIGGFSLGCIMFYTGVSLGVRTLDQCG